MQAQHEDQSVPGNAARDLALQKGIREGIQQGKVPVTEADITTSPLDTVRGMQDELLDVVGHMGAAEPHWSLTGQDVDIGNHFIIAVMQCSAAVQIVFRRRFPLLLAC